MSEKKKTVTSEEVKEEVRKLTEEDLEQVTGGSGGCHYAHVACPGHND